MTEKKKEENKKNVEKSKTKAAGLKSVLVKEEEIVLTSFGKGNKAIIEKRLKKDNVIFEEKPKAFDIATKKYSIEIKGRNNIKAYANNPIRTKKNKEATGKEEKKIPSRQIGQDNLRAKNKLEKMFFGSQFDDNIRIQVAYNILDIKKIMAPYINNIVFAVNNLRRDEQYHEQDMVGMLSPNNSYDVFCNPQSSIKEEKIINTICKSRNNFNAFLKKAKPFMPYMGNAFIIKKEKTEKIDEETQQIIVNKEGKAVKKEQNIYRSNEEIYDIIRLLSMGRLTVVHDKNSTRNLLFLLEEPRESKVLKEKRLEYIIELRNVLDKIYDEKIKKVNSDFFKNNKKSNFQILFKIFNADSKEEKSTIAKHFYEFVVKKEDKNLGFSLRKVREKMLEQESAMTIKDNGYDTVRGKMYNLIDFIIYMNYKAREEDAKDFVANLRQTITAEEKELVYEAQAKVLWKAIEKNIKNDLLPLMVPEIFKEMSQELDCSLIKDILIKSDATYFSKYIYFLTLFLDGKEINEMVSGLINKFENIQSFIDILENKNDTEEEKETETDIKKLFEAYFKKQKDEKEGKKEIGFSRNYRFFVKSGQIANELRLIKSFSRMEGMETISSKEQFFEAARILGTGLEGEEEKNYLEELYFKDNTDKNLRNFIGNNVLQSRRFRYLVKYSNTSKCRKIANNERLIKYVLSKIGRDNSQQIEKYYRRIGLKEDISLDNKIELLTSKIKNLTFKDFIGINQKAKPKSKEAIEKEQKKAYVDLYLTVLYLVNKNLVNINSRYVIAIHCIERDSQLHDIHKDDYCGLTRKFIDNKYLNNHACDNLSLNLQNLTKYIFTSYRNIIAHLGAVTKSATYMKDAYKIESYFDVYHYVLQRVLMADYERDLTNPKPGFEPEITDKIKECIKNIERMKSYSKDFLNILNAPFGYSLPRYKNLSIKDLFDKNEQPTINIGDGDKLH